jgi:sec-independent protein translocase protein TatA
MPTLDNRRNIMSGMSEWLIVLGIVILLFGGSQIPKLAKSLGKARKDFEDGYKKGESSEDDEGAKKDKSDSPAAKTD